MRSFQIPGSLSRNFKEEVHYDEIRGRKNNYMLKFLIFDNVLNFYVANKYISRFKYFNTFVINLD